MGATKALRGRNQISLRLCRRSVNFEIPVKFSANIEGDSAGGKFTSTENSDRVSFGGKLIYQGNLESSLIYTAYLGDFEDNAYTDRDYLAFNVKYAF